MRILAIIVSYYPEQEKLERNITAIYDSVSSVMIWENTPLPDRYDYRLSNKYTIIYASGHNNSISEGLNYAWHYAQENGYDCILSLDQDSEFLGFSDYLSFCRSQFSQELCVIGPWIEGDVNKNEVPFIECERVITAGMIVPVAVLNDVGGYYEKFTVDAIDIEFCYRVRSKGFRVLMYKYASTQQQYGQPCSRKVFGRIIEGNNYPPKRLFGIIRNHVIIYRMYGKPAFLKNEIYYYFRRFIPSIIFIEHNKVKKMYALFSGLISGCFSKI